MQELLPRRHASKPQRDFALRLALAPPMPIGDHARLGCEESFLGSKSSLKDMIAIIKTGSKQYLVKEGDKIKIEKIEGKKGEEIEFADVLLVQDDKKVEIGKPIIKDVKVVGEILEQGKGKKIIIYKYKPKKRYKKKAGHRQLYTEVEIKEILFPTQ